MMIFRRVFLTILIAGPLLVSACAHVYTAHGVYYRIKKGDTLSRISRRYKMSVQEIAEINNIEHIDEIRPGTSVYIPGITPSGFAELMAREGVVMDSPSPRRSVASRGRNRSRSSKPPNTSSESDDSEVRSDPQYRTPETSSGQQEPTDVAASSASPIRLERGRFSWPVDGDITSLYGMRRGRKHDGIDIRAAQGTLVRAAADGEVVYAKRMRGYGNLILLKHRDGFFSVYAHNSVNLVKVGTKVKRGQTVSKVGATGRATGPHLHFEIRKGSKARNPLFFLPKTMYSEKARRGGKIAAQE